MTTMQERLALPIHILNITIGCLCIAILGLTAHSVVLKSHLASILPVDERLKTISLSLLFWPGCGGLVDMCLFIFLWLRTPFSHGTTKTVKAYTNTLVFVASFIFARPLIVLAYTFAEKARAAEDDVNPGTGFVTVESRACASAKRDGTETGAGSEAEKLCRELRAARYLLVSVLLLGTVLLGLMVWTRTTLSKGRRIEGVLSKEDGDVVPDCA